MRKFFAALLVALSISSPVGAMRRVHSAYPGGSPAMERAIEATWPAHLHKAAKNVAWCESRGKATARNKWGYKGFFQMGVREWARWGNGSVFNGVENAAAAYRYYRAAGGFGPWECKP